MKKKVCKKCKAFMESGECPVCKGNQSSTSWQGRIHFIDIEKSRIAKEMNTKKNGEYAIKVR